MQATTARCLAGGSGSGPENSAAYLALLASSSSVTDIGISLSKGSTGPAAATAGPIGSRCRGRSSGVPGRFRQLTEQRVPTDLRALVRDRVVQAVRSDVTPE